MAVDRLLPTQEAEELIALTRDVADKELATRVDEHERTETYPEGLFGLLGEAGLLALPYPEQYGGGDQPYEVYLQVLEELAARWAAIAVAVSVHSLSCYPMVTFGTPAQQRRWLPEMLGGGTVGGYSLSEPQAGSDAAALRCKAEHTVAGYRITGTKAWITHGGKADFYSLFARTGKGSRGVSCFLAPGSADGLSFGRPEEKMGLHAVPTTTANWDGAVLAADRLIRHRRTGVADRVQRAGLGTARHRRRGHRAGPGRTGRRDQLLPGTRDLRPQDHRPRGPRLPARGHGGGRRLLARHVPGCRPPPRRRAAPTAATPGVAKLVATDAAMKVTTDAVQVFGGYGYTRDFPVERYMREAKIMQIFEGTNQIQRLVISRGLAKG